jgi:hypothetical protein
MKRSFSSWIIQLKHSVQQSRFSNHLDEDHELSSYLWERSLILYLLLKPRYCLNSYHSDNSLSNSAWWYQSRMLIYSHAYEYFILDRCVSIWFDPVNFCLFPVLQIKWITFLQMFIHDSKKWKKVYWKIVCNMKWNRNSLSMPCKYKDISAINEIVNSLIYDCKEKDQYW